MAGENKTAPPGNDELRQLLGAIATQITGVAERLDNVERSFGRLEGRVDATQQQLESQIGKLEGRVAATQEQLEVLLPSQDWKVLARAAYPDGPPTDVHQHASGVGITGAGSLSRGQSGYFRR